MNKKRERNNNKENIKNELKTNGFRPPRNNIQNINNNKINNNKIDDDNKNDNNKNDNNYDKIINNKNDINNKKEIDKKYFKNFLNENTIKSVKNSLIIKNFDIQTETNFENKISNPKKSIFSLKTFSDLPINSYLIKTLSKSNYTTMTKIQKKSIPLLLSHKNLIIKSETGTGKTLAYLIPVYEYLININNEKKISRKNGIFCIIFSPTHELCLQIENSLNKIKDSCINVVYGTLMGGQKIEKEKKKLRKGVNILVSTPGRLLYHLKNTKNLNFENLKFLIFDEADLMLSMGFEKEIKECFKNMFKKVENNNNNEEVELNADLFKNYKIILVNATVDGKIKKMAEYLMKGFKAVGFENENNNNDNNNNKINNNINDNKNNNENNDKITYNITNNLINFIVTLKMNFV